ncbi:hypothetical protein GQ600_24814 [Phytophthora cactorum]|nr:hypothetical protein GQ600_24814 [Phytophthora cactorum]
MTVNTSSLVVLLQVNYQKLLFNDGFAYIDITTTNISFFWCWIDPLVVKMLEITYTAPIIAGGSAYCEELENIMKGGTNSFSEPFQEDTLRCS